MSKSSRTAFVAMQFTDDHWRDRRYRVIQEVLEEANYRSVRADEIRSSGAVVDEVCRLLKESDLVVIDSSGSSHSVSYEIGFCHGLGRPPESVLLLRDSTDLPFNYRHYRHRVYRDIRHLRRLLRDYLKISEPISDDQTGYVFSFEFAAGSDGYIFAAASHIFDALAAREFSGRCECYGGEFFGIPGRHCGVGILLRSQKKPFIPDFTFWQDIVKHVTESARAGAQI